MYQGKSLEKLWKNPFIFNEKRDASSLQNNKDPFPKETNRRALPGINGYNNRRSNRITAGGGPTDPNNFFGEGKFHAPSKRDLNSIGTNREPPKIGKNVELDLTSSSMAFNLNDSGLSRRLDSFEQRLETQDKNQRNILEQMMKIQQEIKLDMKKVEQISNDEKGKRDRLESVIKNQNSRISELDNAIHLTEMISKRNKNSLDELITHTKNVERGVNLTQQDVILKKDSQEQRISDLSSEVSSLRNGKESLERMSYASREDSKIALAKMGSLESDIKTLQDSITLMNKMFDPYKNNESKIKNPSLDNGISETKRSIMESKILQLQNTVLETKSQINRESKDREADEKSIISRLNDLTSEIDDHRREEMDRISRLEKTSQSSLSESEKQNLIIQISSVQTEMKRFIEERDEKATSELTNQIKKLEEDMGEERKIRKDKERDSSKKTDTDELMNKTLIVESVEGVRKIFQVENETIRERLRRVDERNRDLEKQIGEIGGELAKSSHKIIENVENRCKVLEARLEDVNDRLRFGMNSLQVAVGDIQPRSKDDKRKFKKEADFLHSGFRESIALELTALNENVNDLKRKLNAQEEILMKRLKELHNKEENASMILGDKLHQKMDLIGFIQERIKRQIAEIQEKNENSQSDIKLIEERVKDLDKNFRKSKYQTDTTPKGLEKLTEEIDDSERSPKNTPKDNIDFNEEEIKKEIDLLKGEKNVHSSLLKKLRDEVDEILIDSKTLKKEQKYFETSITEKISFANEERKRHHGILEDSQNRLRARVKRLKLRVRKMKEELLGFYEEEKNDSDDEDGKLRE